MSFLPKLRSTSASRLRFSKYAINLRAFSCSAGVYQEHEIIHESKVDFETKYAEKLQKRAQEQGKSVLELRLQLKEEEKERRRQKLAPASLGPPGLQGSLDAGVPSSASPSAKPSKVGVPVRKDSSPVKPLASILNLDRLLERPHTAEQVSLLWRAYHASRSGGTGRGFLCASIPVDTYEKMIIIGQKYSSFVVPVPRDNAQTKEDVDRAYEFFLMEWGFHGAPPELSTSRDLFAAPKPSNNPQISTILFTPLQEYKMRTSFATPYLALTHYTDLARSHGVSEATVGSQSSGLTLTLMPRTKRLDDSYACNRY
ncbi:Protein ATP11, mitochondrial [Grifola frondosa]|uniref:Protein ATP11, mitochondrial n=1 Tax=Grifola frondosa TaxID=5627 RepID=A0A1C7MS34_GRIFR|nr:Protein ATP11, mitochondrial [Grifola frondosa]